MFFREVHHVAIIVSDYEKARKFYVEQLEYQLFVRTTVKSGVTINWICR